MTIKEIYIVLYFYVAKEEDTYSYRKPIVMRII